MEKKLMITTDLKVHFVSLQQEKVRLTAGLRPETGIVRARLLLYRSEQPVATCC